MKQIEISGWCRHWFPYRVAVNCRDRTRDSGLTQVEDYTRGPLTVVKFVDALFRLSLRANVKFTGPRAKQRIVDEEWNTLGKSIPFDIPFDKKRGTNRHGKMHGIAWVTKKRGRKKGWW